MPEKVNPQPESIFLSPQERAACQLLSTGKAPHSQRASALLALDQGVTQAQAAENTGLTLGQVRYWLGRFREVRLAIFPEPVMREAVVESPAAVEPAPQEAPDRPKKGKKSKKSKKSKGKKSKSKKGKDRPKRKGKGKKKKVKQEKSK